MSMLAAGVVVVVAGLLVGLVTFLMIRVALAGLQPLQGGEEPNFCARCGVRIVLMHLPEHCHTPAPASHSRDWRSEHLTSSEVWALRETLHRGGMADREFIEFFIGKCAANGVMRERVLRLLDILDLDDDWTEGHLEKFKQFRTGETGQTGSGQRPGTGH